MNVIHENLTLQEVKDTIYKFEDSYDCPHDVSDAKYNTKKHKDSFKIYFSEHLQQIIEDNSELRTILYGNSDELDINELYENIYNPNDVVYSKILQDLSLDMDSRKTSTSSAIENYIIKQ